MRTAEAVKRRLWPARVVIGCGLVAVCTWALLGRPHLPFRLARFEGEWFVERCSSTPHSSPPGLRTRGAYVETFRCVAESKWVTELEIDENGDGQADVRSYFWDRPQPRSCEEWREGRWRPLEIAPCCCRVGCDERAMSAAGCPLH